MSHFTTRPEIAGTFGVVTSTHWIATATGMGMLEMGGNAFDAAVATGLVLQVVEPHMNGPGGEVPILYCRADMPEVKVVCGQGVAPAAATIERFAALDLSLVPGNGLLPAVVPGAFGAWMLLLARHGVLSLREVLSPAIGYARNGYPLAPAVCSALEGVKRLFDEQWRTSAAVYFPHGDIPAPGDLFCNPVLARTYERIVEAGEVAGSDREVQIEAARRAWYEGFVAERIDDFCRTSEVMDCTGRRHRGLLTGDDMARWRAREESPLSRDYARYTVFKTRPWGQGPVFLQQLALLEGFDWRDTRADSAEFVHTVTEAAKLAFADRDAFYGDPDFTEVPLDVLFGREYNDARRTLIGAQASQEWRPGDVPGYGGRVELRPAGSTQVVAYPEALDFPKPASAEFPYEAAGRAPSRGDTCHLDVIDRHGNMVAATPSGGWLDASPVIPALGWGLTPRGEMFWLDARMPSALVPGKRPRTTLTPSLAFRDGEPYMVFGTPGGDQQDQWTLHAFLRHVHFGMNLQEAIDAPEFHTRHLIGSFYPRECDLGHLALEARFGADVRAALERRGHRVVEHGDWALGHVCAARREGVMLRAGASPRYMQAYAAGR